MKLPDTIELRGAVTLGDQVGEGEPRPFTMLAYTGAVVSRPWGPAIFDLEGIDLPLPLPILLNHDETKVVGHATEATFTKRGLELKGVVYDDDETPDGRMVAKTGRRGFPWTGSIGLSGIKWQDLDQDQVDKCNGQELTGPMSIARSMHCYETSFISAGPADKDTHASVLRHEATNQPKEGPMTPEEFLAANPAAVEGWRGEGKLAAVRVLATLLAMFPDQPRAVTKAFSSAEGDALKAQGEMAVLLYQQRTSAVQPDPSAASAPTSLLASVQQTGQLPFGQPTQLGQLPQFGQPAQFAQPPHQVLGAPQHPQSIYAGAAADPALAHAAQVRQGQIAALAQQGHVAPGLGFDGQQRQNLTQAQLPQAQNLSQLPLEERLKAEWDANSRERAAFGGDFKAFAALRRREIAREEA